MKIITNHILDFSTGYFSIGEENLTTVYPHLNGQCASGLGDYKEGFDVGIDSGT